MDAVMGLNGLLDIGSPSFNQKTAVTWVEQQPPESQLSLARRIFDELLSNAALPKQNSGNACSKLCGFVENCSKSESSALRGFAFSQATNMKLFNYFIEWNEQDAHRSMRLVLDYIVSSILGNPATEASKSIRDCILHDTVSVITLEASRPSTKSCMIAVDHFLQKKVFYLADIISAYRRLHEDTSDQETTWDSFISHIFAWMELQYVWTVAGKLLVTILTQPWYEHDASSRHHPHNWNRFISKALKTNLELLEPIKVYIFLPLFTTDPASTLIYLKELTSLQKLTAHDDQGWDVNAMLWVALLEAGRKTGAIGEPSYGSKGNTDAIGQLPTHLLEILLCHKSREARASGLSILVASPSTTKPYAPETLRLLRRYLPSFHEDVDPKIRYDLLGHTRNMTRRLQNSFAALEKESARSGKTKPITIASGSSRLNTTNERMNTGNPQIVEEIGLISPTEALRGYHDFIEWYLKFLKAELAPTVSYQRRITSLKAIKHFLTPRLIMGGKEGVTRPPVNVLVDETWFRSALDLVMDPYDDVRETAASLIAELQLRHTMTGPPTQIKDMPSPPLEEIRVFCQRATGLALRTARADHCDGAARSQELLFRWTSDNQREVDVLKAIVANLDQKLSAAERDLAAAVLQAPVHGDFASLRYIWGSLSGVRVTSDQLAILSEFQDHAISLCERVWRAVQQILCDDSPEGHLPEELQQIEGLDTKDLLSYSFRAIHESSNLMRVIAQNARSDRGAGLIVPSRRNFETIGNLTFDQLSHLRHRGAFSTVSQTFTACCRLVQGLPADENSDIDLLRTWYEGALDCIYTQGSTTRRSAGIPAIIVGILASKTDSPSFGEVIAKLQEIGRQPAFVSETDGSNLAQVHALNCLKDIFKTSFLSDRAEPYLTDCLQLAALSLQSEVWAIRNCGLLLLRSLIDSLFGTNENKLAMEAGWDGRTVRISYHKFEALPSLLVDLLEMGRKSTGIIIGTQSAEAVFPALDIIRRAGPPEGYREKLYDTISWYLGSHIWHVREIAARTLCSLLLTPTWLQSVEQLMTCTEKNSNRLHGSFLAVRFLLERFLQVMPDQLSEENIMALHGILSSVLVSGDRTHVCTEVQAVYSDILNFMAKTAQPWPPRVLPLDSIVGTEQTSNQGSYALLKIRLGETVVRRCLGTADEKGIDMLDWELKAALKQDINVACGILEAISSSGLPRLEAIRSRLAMTYIRVCLATEAQEPRIAALEGLASLLDMLLGTAPGESILISAPSEETIVSLWSDLHRKPLNPGLSDAIIRVSGPLTVVSLLRARGVVHERLARWLRNWGIMMSDAGTSDRTFDTRMAVVESIASLSVVFRASYGIFESSTSHLDAAHLPWLLALYDALTDDDVEVREVAAHAASPILGLALVPVEAGARLLHWLTAHFGHEPDFMMHVVGRMIGHNFGSTIFIASHTAGERFIEVSELGWASAETQLAQAMRFDDSLFVIEEHNQYIDEVREAKRWTEAFLSLHRSTPLPARDEASEALANWTLAGLRTLARIAEAEAAAAGDGPLGWTSKPQVFAICARILTAACAITEWHGFDDRIPKQGEGLYSDVKEELHRFWRLGRETRARVHGLLLSMCGIDG